MKELGTFKQEQGQSERQIGDTNNLKSKWTIVSEAQQKNWTHFYDRFFTLQLSLSPNYTRTDQAYCKT